MAQQSTFGQKLLDLPLFLQLFGIGAASMILPSIYGTVVDDHASARAFFYTGLLALLVFAMIAIAHAGRLPRHGALGPLMSLLCGFVFLPLLFALPFVEAVPTTRFHNAYFEMLSALTTTGATLFDDPQRLPATVHLWRAQVGWMGGLLMWIAAFAILAPLNLGGFEVTARAEARQQGATNSFTAPLPVKERILRASATLLPLYTGLTVLLWCLLIVNEIPALNALVLAMSTLATSGIVAGQGVDSANIGVASEAVLFLFMVFAVSRLTFSKDTTTHAQSGLRGDPEFRIGLIIVIGTPLFLFLRHWLGAYDVNATDEVANGFLALWGSIFTVASFLTTTGFVSAHWADAQSWSALQTPGLILMGLAVIGGGVATTAGGVKLLRVFALYQNGLREMERLVHPNSVSGAGATNRRLQSNGAFIAWIFFSLFALSLAGVTLALAAFGVPFDEALVLTIATLSTTGPLTEFATDMPIDLAALDASAKAILCAAMVLGRLETLAIIALLTPDLWRG